MKLNRKTVLWGIFAALLFGTTHGFALTLGRVHGAVILGSPLDVSIGIQTRAEDEVAAACFEADVRYGDTPLERSRINIKLQPGSQPDSQLVRLTTDSRLDEPVVRLTLRTVCNPKTSRTYVLLSDVASDTVLPAASHTTLPVAITVAPQDRAVTSAAKPSADSAAPVASALVRKKVMRSTLKLVDAPVAAAPKAKAANSTDAKSKAAGVSASALEDLQRRVEEIAKWQSNSISQEDMQKGEARAKAMEADIRGLQEVTAKNQKSIQMVADALESSNSRNYTSILFYGLGALLLLLCLAGLVYVATRKRVDGSDARPWWSGQDERSRGASAAAMAKSTAPMPMAPADSVPGGLTQESGSAQLQSAAALSAAADSTSSLAEHSEAPVAPPLVVSAPKGIAARLDFSHSGAGNLKSINTKEMLDVRQQAEFFMALGQHDEAVLLLESNIKDSSEYNPLVFLDLLKIFHTLGRRAAFEHYREEFNAQFTGRIPPYADFLSEGNGLDAYEDICQQISVLWPNAYAVDYIEQCMVRLPDDDPDQGVDLAAFKDMLLLYGVLKRLDLDYDSNLAPFSTSRTEPTQNGSINGALGGSAATMPLPVAADNSPAPLASILDLDLDLDAAEEPAKPAEHNNLIDFDISAYMDQKKLDPGK
jgi:hypothetical protein